MSGNRNPGAAALLAAGIEHHKAGRLADAISAYRKAARAAPGNPVVFYHLGLAQFSARQFGHAETHLKKALSLKPDYAQAVLVLGNIAEAARDLAGAYELYARAAALDPRDAAAHFNAGVMADTLRRSDTAMAHLRRAATLPAPAALRRDIHNALGKALVQAGSPESAVEGGQHLEAALKIDPNFAPAIINMGLLLRMLGRQQESERWFERAVAADPGNAAAHSNLGLDYCARGAIDKAVACFRRALDINPQFAEAHSNLLFCLQYDPAITPLDVVVEARTWNRFAAGIPALPPAARSWDPDRRLRVGYMSPDFREHACCYYIEPLIRGHSREAVEVFCYAEVRSEDAVTRRIRADADHWRSTVAMSDAELAETIQRDGIDILVDLAGHTAGNRLMALAYRPAPVQVATMIGYSTTTGFAAFNCILGDPYLTPEGSDAHFSERVIRLPQGIAPFLPRETWPEIVPLPSGAPVVFGVVADPSRLDERMVGLWRRILAEVPGSRVLVKHRRFDAEPARREWLTRLDGIADRVEFEGVPGGWGGQMSDFYARVAVVLDSPMHSGNTTVLIPLWMGVPVVTLVGANGWQRAGGSIVSHAGLPELAATTDEQYVQIAAGLANDRPRLEQLRRNLRGMLAASPVCHSAVTVAGIESAYRALWHEAVVEHARIAVAETRTGGA